MLQSHLAHDNPVSQVSKKASIPVLAKSRRCVWSCLPDICLYLEDLDRVAAASAFAQNPALVSMMEAKLGTLVGRPSGYIESLPAEVRRRVAGLKGVQKEHAKLESQFQEEVLELEKKYFTKFTPLYEKRAAIVNGKEEPTDDEVKAGELPFESDDTEGEENKPKSTEPAHGEREEDKMTGIPEFWLSALKNEHDLQELITEDDTQALKFLTDIRMEYLEKPGFRLIFEFAENPFFSNKTITKAYFYQEESGYGGDFIYDHAEGDKINWSSDKDLTVKVESKKQRNKSLCFPIIRSSRTFHWLTLFSDTKQTRVVRKTVPTESFFNFFDPPKAPEGDDEEAAGDVEDRLELDYQLGENIKDKIIPRAIDWFTGEALQYEEMEELEGDFEDEDDEDDEDDLSEEKDEDEESDEEVSFSPLQFRIRNVCLNLSQGDGAKPKQDAAECKQS